MPSKILAADIVKTVGLFQDVRWFGAVLDGVTDDTAAFTAASAAAGDGGTVLVPLGTAILADFALQHSRQALVGTGLWTVLKAKVGATYAVRIESKRECTVETVKFDGSLQARSGLLIAATNAVATSQHQQVKNVLFSQCLVGCTITGTTGAPPLDQVDKNFLTGCNWEDCATGVYINSTNAQICRIVDFNFSSCDVAVRASHGTLLLESGTVQMPLVAQIGVVLDGANMDWLMMRDVWFEALVGNGCLAIDASGNGWPVTGVTAEHCSFAFADITQGLVSLGGTVPLFVARSCRFVASDINTTIEDAVFRDEYNSFESGSIWNPTAAAAATSHRHQWTRQGYWHYYGTVLRAHINTVGDYASNNAANGLVLKSPDGHFWRVLVTNAGALTQTDLGLVMPET